MKPRETLKTNQKKKNTTKQKRRVIKGIAIPFNSTFVDVSNSTISNFRFLNRLKKILILNATNTMITDFSGAPLCPTLRRIRIQGSPISKNPNYRLMILIMFCTDIEIIDDKEVTKSEKDESLSLQLSLQPYLYQGYLLKSTNPIQLTRNGEFYEISPEYLKEAKSKSLEKIKNEQTIEMMEKLSAEISRTSDELGISHVAKLPVRELLKRKKIDTTDFLTQSSDTFLIYNKKENKNSFSEAFNKYTKTEEDLIESSFLLDSPKKQKERHSMIVEKSKRQKDQISSQIRTQKFESENPTIEKVETVNKTPLKQLYEDVVEPSIPNKGNVEVEKIFQIASKIMSSPTKSDKKFISTDLSLFEKCSSIPIKRDSPFKKYGDGLDASRLTQTKFGGYRKISDTESESSEFEEEEEEEENKDNESIKSEDKLRLNKNLQIAPQDVQKEAKKIEQILNDNEFIKNNEVVIEIKYDSQIDQIMYSNYESDEIPTIKSFGTKINKNPPNKCQIQLISNCLFEKPEKPNYDMISVEKELLVKLEQYNTYIIDKYMKEDDDFEDQNQEQNNVFPADTKRYSLFRSNRKRKETQ